MFNGPPTCSSVGRALRKRFFFEKRSKNFYSLRVVASAGPMAPKVKVFCFIFSKKQRLLSVTV
jgi:hypothetical protein